MKGTLHKTEQGWVVTHSTYDMILKSWKVGKFPLHPEDVKQINRDALVFDNIEARIAAYPDVEFEIVEKIPESCYNNPFCNGDETCIQCYKKYAKLVDKLGNEDVPKLGYCEISDEEIEKWAKEYTCQEYKKLIFDYENYDTYSDFVNGAKKYREQLKQRQ